MNDGKTFGYQQSKVVRVAEEKRASEAVRRSLHIPRKFGSQCHHFKKMFQPTTGMTVAGCVYEPNSGVLASPTSLTADGTFNFTLKWADISNISEYQNLFNEIRVKKVKLALIPASNSTRYGGLDTTTAANDITGMPMTLATVIDYDNATALGSMNVAFKYESFKQTQFNEKHIRVFRPRCAATEGATASSMYSKSGDWFALSALPASMFGVKGFCQTSGADLQGCWYVWCTIWFECKPFH